MIETESERIDGLLAEVEWLPEHVTQLTAEVEHLGAIVSDATTAEAIIARAAGSRPPLRVV